MKLYYTPGVCSLAPHVALQEVGAEFELVKVDLRAKTTESGQDYHEISRRGNVPLLQLDNGDTITEGNVILSYIADSHPESNLAPANGTMERVRLDEWLNFITTDLHKSFYVFFFDGGDQAKTLYQNKLNKHFVEVNDVLGENDFITGSNFTIADPYLYTVLSWARMLEMDMTSYPNIATFMNRMEERPSMQRAMTAEGLMVKKVA